MKYKVKDELHFGRAVYIIDQISGTNLILVRVRQDRTDLGPPIMYPIRDADRNLHNGAAILVRDKKGKVKEKKKGPEMQHCPFCMAAWLNEDANQIMKTCKYCGSNLY